MQCWWVVHLDNSGHVVAGVVSAAASLAEEQNAGHQCQQSTGNSDEESPVEHGLVFVEADIIILVHEAAIHRDANGNADSCNIPTEQSSHPSLCSCQIYRYRASQSHIILLYVHTTDVKKDQKEILNVKKRRQTRH